MNLFKEFNIYVGVIISLNLLFRFSKSQIDIDDTVINRAPIVQLLDVEENRDTGQIIKPVGGVPTFKAHISCESDWPPITTCSFLKNGQALDDERYYTAFESRGLDNDYTAEDSRKKICSLEIENPSKEDSGFFNCILENEYGSSRSKTIEIVFTQLSGGISGKPDQIREYHKGQSFLLNCNGEYQTDLEKRGIIKFDWFSSTYSDSMSEENALDTTSPNFAVLKNGSLAIIEPDEFLSDTSFICTKTVEYDDHKLVVREAKKILKLIEDDKNKSELYLSKMNSKFLYPNMNIQQIDAVANRRLHLEAVHAKKGEIIWSSDPPENLDAVSVRQGGRIVHFANIQRRHQGRYTARHNETGSEIDYYVTVESAPEPLTPLKSHIILANTDLQFDCTSISIPETNYAWYINGSLIDKAHPFEYTFSENEANLKISQVEHSMVVQCNASNKHGYILQNSVVVIAEATQSALSESYTNYFEAGYYQTVSLPCLADYDTNVQPKFSWSLNDSILTPSSKYKIDKKSGSLVFRTGKTDEGNYTCNVQTPYDNISVTLKLKMNPNISAGLGGPIWLLILLILLCVTMLFLIFLLLCFYVRGRRVYYVYKSEKQAGRDLAAYGSARSINYSQSKLQKTQSQQLNISRVLGDINDNTYHNSANTNNTAGSGF